MTNMIKLSKEDREVFFNKKKILENSKKTLKQEFVGLDDIIDEVLSLIEPWYLFPSAQIRPTIINLWGMTGVGKTSLIKRLFQLIELGDNLYKFDVGDYASQDNSKLSYSFSENLKNREKAQIGIIFDEFQLGRTIDEHNAELSKSGLRAMWDLLDSGKLSILQTSYYGTKVFQLTFRLEDCVRHGGVRVENGIIVDNKNYHDKYFKSEEVETAAPALDGENKKAVVPNFFVPSEYHYYVRSIWEERFMTNRELSEFLRTLDAESTIDFLNDTLDKACKSIEYDYSTSCIFVIGNIDEAYKMSKNVDPDTDADRFHKHSLGITLPHIKHALHKRFRSEQIARLGNNHIIYPAFSSKIYKSLISMELDKVVNKIKDKFNLSVIFEKSVNSILYKEGVFPSQGARPVFTTITSLIESYVGKVVTDILESNSNINQIKWSYSRNNHIVKFFSDEKLIITRKYPVRLKIENLRKSDNSELQASVAVHESGHAVAAIYGAKLVPTEILSKTANLSEGFCAIEFPNITTKEIIEQDIIISLAGYVSEKMIFGPDNLSNGTYGDFERATNKALEMTKLYGMSDNVPMFYGHPSAQTNTSFNSHGVIEAEDMAAKIVKECEQKCKNILKDNKLLLLKLSEYLSKNSRMDSKKIMDYIKKYGKPVDIKDRNNYFNFKEVLASKLLEANEKNDNI